MKSEIKPIIGRIVIYVMPNEVEIQRNNGSFEAPAVIVNTLENTSYQDSEVNLKVLTDSIEDCWATSVPYSTTAAPGTWHWPPR